MRRVDFPPLSREVSVIGFGCASLGSRVGARLGTAALDRAYDAGVTWFDVAPSYGDGDAEILLGRFLIGKRSNVAICTKVGILPARVSLPLRMVRPLARRVIRSLPGLRKHLAGVRPSARRVNLTGALIESSIAESLRRLRTDYVDVLALHDSEPADVCRDDVLRALDSIIRKGHARAISVAGDLEAALAASSVSERLNIIQISNSPFARNIELAQARLPAGRAIRFISHGVFGHRGPLDRLTDMIERATGTRALIASVGYREAPRSAAAAFLLDFALASNPGGVTLLSMYQPHHVGLALNRLAESPPADAVLDLGKQLVGAR